MASLANSKALAVETAGVFVQVVPSVVYCHVPLAVSRAVTARPWEAVALGSAIFVPPRLAMMVEISVPVLALSFWFWGLRVGTAVVEGGGVVDEDGDGDRAADAGAVFGGVGEGVYTVEVGVGGVEDLSTGVDRDR